MKSWILILTGGPTAQSNNPYIPTVSHLIGTWELDSQVPDMFPLDNCDSVLSINMPQKCGTDSNEI